MAISYVGANGGFGTGSGGVTVDLTALSGGSNSSPSTGDIVLIVMSYNSSGTSTPYPPAMVTSGYTTYSTLYANRTSDANVLYAYKIMGGTPDTSVSVNVPTGVSRGFAVAVHVWRGVDQTTPMDVTPTTALGLSGCIPDSPSITPTTTGAIVISIGGTAYGNSINGVTGAPSGYTNFYSKYDDSGATSSRACACFASKAWTSGAEDPGAFTGSSSSTAYSFGAITMALRPFVQSGPANLKSYNTNTKANIKTINTNVIANVKSLNTNV